MKRVCIKYDELGRQKMIAEYVGNGLTTGCDLFTSLKNTGWPGALAMLMSMIGMMAVPRWSLRYSLRRLRVFIRHPILSVCHSERSEESLSSGCRSWDIERLRALRNYRPMSRWLRFMSMLLIPFCLLSFMNPGPEVFAACTCPTSNGDDQVRVYEFTYDDDGHITQICSPEGTIHYEYDAATGRHTRTYTGNPASPTTDTRYAYDEMGRLKTVTVVRLNNSPTNLVTTYTYTDVGSRASVTLPNGTKTKYTYDSLNRLKKLENRNTSNVLLSSYEYTLHETGRRTGATEIILQPDDNSYITNNITWQYDGMYRLTNEVRGATTDGYTYDLAGNRKAKTMSPGLANVQYYYNANDQLTNEVSSVTGATSYLYDANGSLTNKTVAGGSTYNYAYNAQNQLSAVTVDGVTTSYVYNHAGIRVRSTTGSTTTYFLVDPNNPTGYAQVLEEGTVQSGVFNLSRSYILGDDVLAQVSGSTPQYLLYDGHGSTRQLSQTTVTGGTHVVEQYNYDAYGVGLSLPSSPATSMLYAGEQWDTNAKQYYLRARYYDPSNGRFSQRDTFAGNKFDPQSLHKYAYAHNDPVNGLDPSGNFTLAETMIATTIAVDIEANMALATLRSARAIEKALFPLVHITADQVSAFHKELAKLCSDVYPPGPNGLPAWQLVGDPALMALGLDPANFENGPFFSALYRNGGEYVLAFRGTNEGADWLTNIGQGALGPLLRTQYEVAAALADQVNAAVGDASLTMTGHSLGGGLASAAAFETDRPCVTFNAAPLSELSYLYYGGALYTSEMVNYSIRGEILTTASRAVFLAPPTTFCRQYQLDPAPVDVGANPVTLHKMPAVLHALGL
jgi:RHS repeat-associated protein